MPKGSFNVACDAGYGKARELCIQPDLVLGDFDSLGYIPRYRNVEVYPSEKDDTDTAIAVQRGLALGCDRVVIYGALGGRLDHTVANLHIAAELSRRGIYCLLVGKNEVAAAITNSELSLKGTPGSRVSVFAWGGEARGVSLSGLKYPLGYATLSPNVALGVSNEFVDESAKISVDDGTLVLVLDLPGDIEVLL